MSSRDSWETAAAVLTGVGAGASAAAGALPHRSGGGSAGPSSSSSASSPTMPSWVVPVGVTLTALAAGALAIRTWGG